MSDDLISRQAALGIIQSLYPGMPRIPLLLKDWQKRYEPYINAEKAISALPSAQPKLRWIPVSEKLPEVNTRCLCTYEHKEGTCIDFGLYMKHGWFVSGVTAWMPLPEPYKEDKA